MSDSKELLVQQQTNGIQIKSLEDVKRVSNIFVQSGMFKSDRNATAQQKMYQAGVKILAGAELGLPPFASMNSINIIEGRPEMSGNLIASLVKKHDRYDYRIRDWTNKGCTVDIYELDGKKRELLGSFTFDEEDAKAAGLTGRDNWRKYAKAMFFNRAISAGTRAFCPDVFFGVPVYTEGELSGEFVDAEVVDEGELSGNQTPLIAKDNLPSEADVEAVDNSEALHSAIEQGETISEGEKLSAAMDKEVEAFAKSLDESTKPEVIAASEIIVDAAFKTDIQIKMGELGLGAKEQMMFIKKVTGKPYPPKVDAEWRAVDAELNKLAGPVGEAK